MKNAVVLVLIAIVLAGGKPSLKKAKTDMDTDLVAAIIVSGRRL